MNVWYIIVIAILIIAFLIIEKIRDKKEEKRIDKIIQKNKEAESAQAEKQTEAAKTKQDAKTGNPRRDSEYMANKLHELANK